MHDAPLPVCQLAPQQMAGPYFRNPGLERYDLTEGLPGVRVELVLRLRNSSHCAPLSGVRVDIWHCDARGRYSGWSQVDPDQEAPSGEIGSIPRTDDDTYLRGSAISDCHGEVAFLTLFPGFYAGRATHIHVAVRIEPGVNVAYVGQLYFPPLIARLVSDSRAYAGRRTRRLENQEDELYVETAAHSQNLIVAITSTGEFPDHLQGYIDISLEPLGISEHIQPQDFDQPTV